MTKIKTKFKQTETGLIPNGWEEIIFSEAVEINPKRDLKKGTVTKAVAMEDIQPFTKKIRNYTLKKFKGGSKFKNNDTLFARITPSLENGKTAFVDILSCNEIGFGSTEFIVLSAKKEKAIPNYVYYLSRSPEVRNIAIKSMTGTSGRQRVENNIFDTIVVLLPKIKEQKKIGKILYDLDTKIENLQKQNKILEQIAQAIFKSWFVDYEFPDENGRPYKLSGGEMVCDEESGKTIPKGWKINPICKFGKIICGKTPPKYNKEFFGGDMLFIKIPDMHNQSIVISTEDSLSSKGEKFQKNKILPAGSICVSCIATIGLVSITSKRSQTNQQINSIIPNQKSLNYYLFFSMKLLNRDLLNVGSGGSATPNINTNTFSNMKIINPDPQILEIFYNLVHPMFSKLLSNTYELKSLTFIRDSLLPKLISGEIRV